MLRLTAERKARGLSMSAFARSAEMHISSISAIETQMAKPWPGQIRKIAGALDWPLDRADELFEEIEEQ